MAKQIITIANQELSLDDLFTPLHGPCEVAIGAGAGQAIAAAHRTVAELLRREEPIYGVNTGFGKLANARIAPGDLAQLQINLLRSHAAGTGAPS